MKILGEGTATGQDREFLVSAMKRLDLFACLSDEQLNKAILFVKSVEFEAGETVFCEGFPGDTFYVIQEGKVEARGSSFLGLSRSIRVMGVGEFFGEIGAVLKQSRSATIVCLEKTSCFSWNWAALEIVLERNAAISDEIRKVAKERLKNYS